MKEEKKNRKKMKDNKSGDNEAKQEAEKTAPKN